jgi:hypothetical protein
MGFRFDATKTLNGPDFYGTNVAFNQFEVHLGTTLKSHSKKGKP